MRNSHMVKTFLDLDKEEKQALDSVVKEYVRIIEDYLKYRLIDRKPIKRYRAKLLFDRDLETPFSKSFHKAAFRQALRLKNNLLDRIDTEGLYIEKSISWAVCMEAFNEKMVVPDKNAVLVHLGEDRFSIKIRGIGEGIKVDIPLKDKKLAVFLEDKNYEKSKVVGLSRDFIEVYFRRRNQPMQAEFASFSSNTEMVSI